MNWIVARTVVGILGVATCAAMPVFVMAQVRGAVPVWAVWCGVPFAFLVMALAIRSLLPLTRRPIAEDQSLPWSSFRVARRCEVQSHDEEDVSLVLELLEEGFEGPAVTLRFEGVSRLSLQQYGTWCIVPSGLVCEILRKPDGDGARFLVRDVRGETLQFRCRAFDVVT